MVPREIDRYRNLGFISCLAISQTIACSVDPAIAQVIPDSTLGDESSTVTPSEPNTEIIDGGAIRGANLFHSFQEFNVGEGRSVYFSNPTGIANILSRVTGTNPSEILGKLGVLGNADLFLINPNGIIFGADSSLDLRGSFIATTASKIDFADGSQFTTLGDRTQPLLTISIPIGLQFGDNPGKIINRSIAVDFTGLISGLQIDPGKTLALVGGDVVLEGGAITSNGGKIEIGSVGKDSLVRLNHQENWSLNYENARTFQDIKLVERFDEVLSPLLGFSLPSTINVISSNDSSGKIKIQGRSLFVDGSQINILSQDATPSGNLTINASEAVEIINNSFTAGGLQTTLASATLAKGNAGNIAINSKKLSIGNASSILTESTNLKNPQTQNILTVATGRGGDININASESVNIQGAVSSQSEGSGEAGNIKLETGKLKISDTGTITVSSNGTGNAGNIKISADAIKLDRQGKIEAEAGNGKGGNIFLEARNLLILRNQSQISSTAGIQGQGGKGGNINISSPLVVAFPQENSDITANAFTGKGGNIEIHASGVFGFNRNNRVTSLSDITASSELGENGTVRIFLPEFRPEQRIAVLPETVVDLTNFEIKDLCRLRRDNIFTIAGRSGMPTEPDRDLQTETVWEDWRINYEEKAQRRTEAKIPKNNREIVNIQGWYINDRGRVVLTDRPMDSFFSDPKASGFQCH
jgi:filamentous hemagglutinin family protein